MATNKNKKPVERKFVDASSGKTSAKKTTTKETTAKDTSAKKTADKDTAAKKPKASLEAAVNEAAKTEASGKTRKQRALGFRLGALGLWLLAIAFEVLVILRFKGTLYIPGELLTHIVIGIALDLICVFIGSQLWKKANRIDPISKKNKLKFFLWNQMGVFAAVAAFFPLFLLLLKEKKIDERVRRICAIIAGIALLLSVGFSIDYNPVSSEDLSAAQANSTLLGDGTVYWTQWGRSYHLNPDCHTLLRSSTIYHGAIEDAFEANRTDPCDFCAVEDGTDLIDKGYVSQTDLTVVEDETLEDLSAPAE